MEDIKQPRPQLEKSPQQLEKPRHQADKHRPSSDKPRAQPEKPRPLMERHVDKPQSNAPRNNGKPVKERTPDKKWNQQSSGRPVKQWPDKPSKQIAVC